VLARVRSTVYRTFYLQRLIAAQVTTSGSHSEAKAKVSSKCFAYKKYDLDVSVIFSWFDHSYSYLVLS
jgi:hypothetical protein